MLVLSCLHPFQRFSLLIVMIVTCQSVLGLKVQYLFENSDLNPLAMQIWGIMKQKFCGAHCHGGGRYFIIDGQLQHRA